MSHMEYNIGTHKDFAMNTICLFYIIFLKDYFYIFLILNYKRFSFRKIYIILSKFIEYFGLKV